MEKNSMNFMKETLEKILKTIKKVGYYTPENIKYMETAISDYEFREQITKEESKADEMLKIMIEEIENSGFKLENKTPEASLSEQLKASKKRKTIRNIVIGGAIIAVVTYGGVELYKNLTLDKEAEHEIEQPIETEVVEFDINNKEQLKLATEFVVEQAAAKGFEISAEEALDFVIVSNIRDLDAEKLAYLFSSVRGTNEMYTNFNKVANKMSFDAFTVTSLDGYVDASKMINDVEDKAIVKKFQTLLANLTIAINNEDKAAREKAATELTAAISDLYNTDIDNHNSYSSAANIIIIKQLVAGFTLENSIMDANTRIAIYGSETCDKKSGSILDLHMKGLEKDLIAKYDMMMNFALDQDLVSEYETTLNAIETTIVANVIADSVDAVAMQFKANGIKTNEQGVPAKTTTVVTTKTPAQNPSTTAPAESAKVDPTKPVYTQSEAEIAKKAIVWAQQRADIDAMNDTEFMTGTGSYYAKRTNNALYNYDLNENKNNAVYLKAYKEQYWKVYNEKVVVEAKVSGSLIGKEIATVNFKNQKTLDASKAVSAALSSRPSLLNNKAFVDAFTGSFVTSYNSYIQELAKIKANADLLGIKTNVTITDSTSPKEIYNENGSSFVVTPNTDVHYVDAIYAETDLVCVKDSNGKELYLALADAREKGYKVIYRMVDGVLKEFPMPEKGKSR